MNPFARLQRLAAETRDAGQRMDAQRPRFDRLRDRHTNGAAPQAVAAWQLFQTPPQVAARLAALLPLKPGARCLEPSAGLGRLLDALAARRAAPESVPLSAHPLNGKGRGEASSLPSFAPVETALEITAVEIAADCARVLFEQNRPGVTLKQRDFLTCTPADLGTFDCVAMNPPFHLRADVQHILHARTFLRPGGRLVALCLDTHHREAALRPLASHWEKLPAGTFAKEGTHVPTVLLALDA